MTADEDKNSPRMGTDASAPSPGARHPAAQPHAQARAALARGDLKAAGAALQKAMALGPRIAAVRATAGDLLVAMGRAGEAAGAYEDALTLDPAFAAARLGLAQLLLDQGRAEDALGILEPFDSADARHGPAAEVRALKAFALLALDRPAEALQVAGAACSCPDTPSISGLFARGRALSALARYREAIDDLTQADGLRPGEPGILCALGKARVGAGDLQGAERAFRAALDKAPSLPDALDGLCQVLWMDGRSAAIRPVFEAAKTHGTKNPDPWYREALTLNRMGEGEAALDALRAAQARFGVQPGFDFLAADILRETGDLDAALVRARRAHEARPQDWTVATALVRALLQAGKAQEALGLCDRALGAAPLDQIWLAFRATAMRALGHPPRERDGDYDRLITVADLSPPDGYADMDAFNTALAERLHALHGTTAHPLDQSLRGGTQTTVPLQHLGDPVIDAFFQVLKAPVDTFIHTLPDDPSHPFFSRRAAGWRLSGAWSVRLRPDGYHVNHVHGGGWISSAYYVTLPPGIEGSQAREGWLKFGEPPFPVPGAPGPEHVVEPKQGRLALFPSFLWHGTVPFTGHAPRLTIAMDIVPTD